MRDLMLNMTCFLRQTMKVIVSQLQPLLYTLIALIFIFSCIDKYKYSVLTE